MCCLCLGDLKRQLFSDDTTKRAAGDSYPVRTSCPMSQWSCSATISDGLVDSLQPNWQGFSLVFSFLFFFSSLYVEVLRGALMSLAASMAKDVSMVDSMHALLPRHKSRPGCLLQLQRIPSVWSNLLG